MSDEIECCKIDPGVAVENQSHAVAVDALRGAEDYVLVIRAPDRGPEFARVLSAGNVDFLAGAALAAKNMALEAHREALRHAIREGLEREEETS